MSTIKTCVTCKYYTKEEALAGPSSIIIHTHYVCHKDDGISLVSGKFSYEKTFDCFNERSVDGNDLCGISGKYWVNKND